MQTLRKALYRVSLANDWVGKIVCWLIVVMFVIICYEIFMRFLFDKPTYWVHETSGFLICYTAMLGGGYTLAHGGHVNVDILYSRLTPRTRAVLDLVTWLLFYTFIIILIWKGSDMALRSINRMEHSFSYFGPPLYFIKPILPVGAILIFVQGLTKTIRDFYMAITGKDLEAK